MATGQFQEIIGLQQQIVELKESVGLLIGQAPGHRVLLHHCIHGEELSDIAQELDVANLAQPIVIIDHDRIGGTVAKCQEGLKGALDAFDV